jgi:hypothetical protein
VTGSVPTTLLKIIHINTLPLSVTNQVVRAVTKLHVSLVLDVTGSMAEVDGSGTSKISALKTATHQLLNQLQGAAINAGDVQVAIIPFSKDVNAGTANVNANWIDWTNWEAPPPNSMPPANRGPLLTTSCPYGTSTNPFGYGCLNGHNNTASSSGSIMLPSGDIVPGKDNGNYNAGRRDHYYNGWYDSIPVTNTTHPAPTTTTVCTNSTSCTVATYCSGYPSTSVSTSGPATTTTATTCECHTTSGTKKTCTRTATPTVVTVTAYNHNWHSNNHNTWNGCIWDRDQNNDALNTTPDVATAATLFPAENYAYCPPAALMGMSFDWAALSNKVDQLAPNGATNQTVGMQWGWQALTQGAPLNAPAGDATTINVVILLSDGLNTQDRWWGDGVNPNTNVDNRLAAACNNVKAANVRVYTVLVMSGNSTVLSNCATDSSKYFALTTAGAIVTTFNTIGTELANLHLSL